MRSQSQIMLAVGLLSVANVAQAQHPLHSMAAGTFHPFVHHAHGWHAHPAMAFYGMGYSPYATAGMYAYGAQMQAYGAQMQYQQQALQVAERQVELGRDDRRARISRIEARRSDQEAVSQRRTEQRLAKPRRQAAARLASDELSPKGTLRWPEALGGEEFRAQRDQIERFFVDRAAGGASRANVHRVRTLQQSADELLVQLTRQIKELSPRDYLAAQSFVRRLALEARSDGGVTQLAGQ